MVTLWFLCGQTLKKDVLQTKERELFTYFHLHPERLKQTVDSLEKRLQAHSIKWWVIDFQGTELEAGLQNWKPGHSDVEGHILSIAFRHLPPNSARFSYAPEGALFISLQLSTDTVSALQKVWVLIWPQKQPSAQARM